MNPPDSALAPAVIATSHPVVAVVGLGYVGLPTSLALNSAGLTVIGIDVSQRRLDAIAAADVDLLERDLVRLRASQRVDRLRLSVDPAAMAEADAVIIAVPTPVDEQMRPDLRAVESACAATVEHARAGQTIILTSTTYVGTTRELLIEPLERRGLVVGEDVHVAFAPERILPGEASVEQTETPRVLGGATPACTRAAARVLAPTAKQLHLVSSTEAAELTKLHENTFRAVNLAFANEMAAVAMHHGIHPVEIVEAAGTKPYGYLAHFPSAGIGGHCIPVDPYYLLQPLADSPVDVPIATTAMHEVAARPGRVAARALDLLESDGVIPDQARVLVVGMAYKPGVADARESPAEQIAEHLLSVGVHVSYHDPLVERITLRDGKELTSEPAPHPAAYDLVVLATVHPGIDYAWLDDCELVLDATYRQPVGRRSHLA
ncbi:MAG: nucleotide sugar dehydrogenase [Solirubrobacterales bacterium]|jgi:nucleotide sugar dehydrogenase|nr:nucleotide sugar dehydrogenase [Solirubrobacterales bacterium]